DSVQAQMDGKLGRQSGGDVTAPQFRRSPGHCQQTETDSRTGPDRMRPNTPTSVPEAILPKALVVDADGPDGPRPAAHAPLRSTPGRGLVERLVQEPGHAGGRLEDPALGYGAMTGLIGVAQLRTGLQRRAGDGVDIGVPSRGQALVGPVLDRAGRGLAD